MKIEITDEQVQDVWTAANDCGRNDLHGKLHSSLEKFLAPYEARVKELKADVSKRAQEQALDSEMIRRLEAELVQSHAAYSSIFDEARRLEAQLAQRPTPESYSDAQVQAAKSLLWDRGYVCEEDDVGAALAAAGVPAQEPVAVLRHVQASDPATAGVTYEECRAIYDAALEGDDDEEGDLSPLRDALQKSFLAARRAVPAQRFELTAIQRYALDGVKQAANTTWCERMLAEALDRALASAPAPEQQPHVLDEDVQIFVNELRLSGSYWWDLVRSLLERFIAARVGPDENGVPFRLTAPATPAPESVDGYLHAMADAGDVVVPDLDDDEQAELCGLDKLHDEYPTRSVNSLWLMLRKRFPRPAAPAPEQQPHVLDRIEKESK